eukprot:1061292-Amphidinium_carterae.1
MEARELHYVLHGSLELVLKDLDLGLIWQATSRDVQVRSAQFGVSDVQTLGSTMLVEMRMRDEEQRAKQLVINPSATRTPQAASGEYEAEQWTTQEWEEYEAEVAAGQGRPTQSTPKLCSAYASKDGCPKGALCVMASKGGHPRMRDKCLQCGSEGH